MSNAAVRGWLIAALMFASAPMYGQGEGEPKPETRQPNAEQPQAKPQAPSPFKITVTFGDNDKDKTNWGKPECGNPGSHDEADLCQQREAVKIAKESMDVAKETLRMNDLQVSIGIAALFGLVVTAALAFWAAYSAHNQVLVSRNTANRQLRAYVWAFHGDVIDQVLESADVLEVRINVNNLGQTPAYDVQVWIECASLTEIEALGKDFKITRGEAVSKTVLHQGELMQYIAQLGEIIPPKEAAEIKTYGLIISKKLYVWGEISYRDTFGVSYESFFCFKIIYLSNGVPFWTRHGVHNRAT